MTRHDFHKQFRSVGPVVLPVVHVLDNDQAERNVAQAIRCGADGVFLINHDFSVDEFLPVIRHVRKRYPSLWLGVNFLAVTLAAAMPILADLQRDNTPIDGYWADDARIDESRAVGDQPEARQTRAAIDAADWQGLYFGGTAFKKQRPVASQDYAASAAIASQWMDVVTTSGVATGSAADMAKIEVFRQACAGKTLAVASGITPQNAADYAPLVDAFLVATGINKDHDFYNIDVQKLQALLAITRAHGAQHG